jgi:TPR repeat protein
MSGTGVSRDSARALSYTLMAARRGGPGAEYDAGLLILHGAGIAPDLVEAYKWFALAARSQYPGAAQNRQVVMAQMSAEQIRRAEELVAAFRPEP